MKRIALFGGTFDPIHDGHLQIAQTAVEKLQLDQIIFIPCQQSPHKEKATGATGPQRLEMLERAIQKFSWASVDHFELLSEDPSYSWKTAEEFSTRFPEAKLYWLIGDDQWAKLHKWSRIDHLKKLVTFIVHSRHETTAAHEPVPGIHSEHIHGSLHPASSSQIRFDLSRSRPAQWLDPSVARYIKKHDLYQESRAE